MDRIRFLALLLVLSGVFWLTACGKKETPVSVYEKDITADMDTGVPEKDDEKSGVPADEAAEEPTDEAADEDDDEEDDEEDDDYNVIEAHFGPAAAAREKAGQDRAVNDGAEEESGSDYAEERSGPKAMARRRAEWEEKNGYSRVEYIKM